MFTQPTRLHHVRHISYLPRRDESPTVYISISSTFAIGNANSSGPVLHFAANLATSNFSPAYLQKVT